MQSGIEWQVVSVIVTLVSFIAIFVGCAWKFGSMITKLETLIQNLSNTIEKMEAEQEKDKLQILQRIEEHDKRLGHVEKEIIKLGGEE